MKHTKGKIFAVPVWTEDLRTVYVRANTAKQAEKLIDECRYVEGENNHAETIIDALQQIGVTTRDGSASEVDENYRPIAKAEDK